MKSQWSRSIANAFIFSISISLISVLLAAMFLNPSNLLGKSVCVFIIAFFFGVIPWRLLANISSANGLLLCSTVSGGMLATVAFSAGGAVAEALLTNDAIFTRLADYAAVTVVSSIHYGAFTLPLGGIVGFICGKCELRLRK